MAAIAGICHLDGSPVDAAALDRLAADLAGEGPPLDASRRIMGACGLVGRGAATTPQTTPQPLHDAAAGNSIVFAGRLDNRRVLLDALQLQSDPAHPLDDATLILACYRAWGSATAAHLLGDFAFAVWNQSASRLYCARDYSGTKPLYYSLQARRLIFASQIRQVLDGLDFTPPPNEGMIAEYLVGAYENKEETLYQGVFRLPPGHQLTVADGAIQIARFWDIEPATTIRYRRDADYLDHFIEIFRTAVTARLRCVGTLGATLSGGLDSSSVVGVAAALLQEEGAGRSLATYSMVFPGLDNDESPYIDAVTTKWGLRSHRFPWRGFAPTHDWLRQAREVRGIPDYPTLAMSAPLIAGALGHGVRVLFTGEGGDNWLTGTRYPYRELLAHGKFARAARELMAQSGARGYRYALANLLGALLWPSVPASLRARIERSRERGSQGGILQRRFRAQVGLAERLHGNDCAEKFARLPQWAVYRLATSGPAAHYYEIADRFDAGFGIERTHPLLDRRIAEFAMAIPDYVHHARRRGKLLLREATPAILPPLVGNRLNRGEFSIAYARALASPQVLATLESPRAAIREWLEPDQLDACLRLARQGTDLSPRGNERDISRCWMAFAVEAWLRGAYQTSSQLAI